MENEVAAPSIDTPHLKAVHQCINCGRTCERDHITEEEMITGSMVCAVCGHFGPLRVVVVEIRKTLMIKQSN